MSQQGSGARSSATGGPPQAMMELARDREDCWLVGPIYHLPFFADGTHLTNLGYRRLGRYYARALKSILVDRQKPLQMLPVSAILRGARVTVQFSVPQPPLVLDVEALAATTDMGFAVKSASGTSTITSVMVGSDGTSLDIYLAAAPGANPVLHCARDHLGTGLVINNSGSTNLRDSTDDPVLIGGVWYPTWHVAPHFMLPITIVA